jgi:hypothetical protein
MCYTSAISRNVFIVEQTCLGGGKHLYLSIFLEGALSKGRDNAPNEPRTLSPFSLSGDIKLIKFMLFNRIIMRHTTKQHSYLSAICTLKKRVKFVV